MPLSGALHGGVCPPSHQILFLVDGLPYSPYQQNEVEGKEELNGVCLTCFLALLTPTTSSMSSLPSLADLQQRLLAILTILTQQCPSCTDTNPIHLNALRRWVWYTLDPSLGAAAPELRSGSQGTRRDQVCVGPMLADILVALYCHLVHHADPTVLHRTTTSSGGGGDGSCGGGCCVASLELIVFTFAAWEVALAPGSGNSERRATAHHNALPRTLQPSSMPFVEQSYGGTYTAAFSPRRAAADTAYVATRRVSEAQNTLQHSKEEEGGKEDELRRVAAYTAVCAVVGRMVDVVRQLHLCSASQVTPSRRPPYSSSEQLCRRTYTAASLLYRIVTQVPLFTRALGESGHLCALVRFVLPSFAKQCAQSVSSTSTAPRKRARDDAPTHDVTPADALRLLLQVILRTVAGLSVHSAACGALTAQLVAEGRTAAALPITAEGIERGVSLLGSLILLLGQAHPRCTPLVLTLLRESLTWPATRARLLAELCSCGGSNSSASDAVVNTCQVLGESPSACTHDSTPYLFTIAVAVAPLLLHPSGDTVHLACDVLRALLTALAVHDVASSASVGLRRRASRDVAGQLEGYVMQALDAAVDSGRPALCATVVEVMEHVAAILEEEAAEGEAVESGRGGGMHVEEWQQYQQQQQWAVIFRVARVDFALFERLVAGTVLRRALHSHVGVQGSGRGNSSSRDGSGVEWHSVAATALHTVLDNTATPLSLYAYLHLLDALAKGAGASLRVVWPEGIARLVDELAKRVDAHMRSAAVAAARGDSLPPPLHRVLEPRTHQLLVFVTAAYLPYTEATLYDVAVLLLKDVVDACGGVASARCPERVLSASLSHTSMGGRYEDAEEEECSCLLALAAALMEAHDALVHVVAWSAERKEEEAMTAFWCPCCAADASLSRESSWAQMLHDLCAPSGDGDGGARRESLLDVLLSLHPDSPALLEARVRFVRTILGKMPSRHTQSSLLTKNPLALLGVASVRAVVAIVGMTDEGAWLLLALTTWQRTPCVDECVVAAFTHAALQGLHNELKEAIERLSGLSTTIGTTASVREAAFLPAAEKDQRVACAVQRYLALLLIHLRCCGTLPSLSSPSVSMSASAATEGSEVLLAQALLRYTVDSPLLRREISWFWFFAESRHHVQVHRTLTTLSSLSSACTSPRVQLCGGLAAVTMLSALSTAPELAVSEADEGEEGENTEAVTAAFVSLLDTFRTFHWLSDVFVSAGNTMADAPTFSARLFLSAVFPRSFTTRCCPGWERACDGSDDGGGGGDGLRYVLTEALHLVRRRCAERRTFCASTAAAHGDEETKEEVASRAEGRRRFFHFLLVQHLTPFLTSYACTAATLSIYICAADLCTATMLRLSCISLWFLSSCECSECDEALMQYALRLARLCLGLTEAEVCSSYALADDVDGDGGGSEEENGCVVDGEGGSWSGETGAERDSKDDAQCVPGLRRLTLLVLQLLYLLLMRSNRLAVALADCASVAHFAATAKRASAMPVACTKRGSVDVHVLAAVVQLHLRRLRCNNSKRLQEAAVPWYAYFDVNAFITQVENFHSCASLQRRVWVLLAGAECALRLCPPDPQPPAPRSTTDCLSAGTDCSNALEWAASIRLSELCHAVLTTQLHTRFFTLRGGDDPGEAMSWCVVAAARLAYMLLHHCRWLMPLTGHVDDLMIAFCARGPEADSGASNDGGDCGPFLPCQPPHHLLAEGWVLAGLLNAVLWLPEWRFYQESFERQVVTFLSRPAVAQALQRLHAAPPQPPRSAATAATEVSSSLDGEVRLLLLTLVAAIRTYERTVARLKGLPENASTTLLPVGTPLLLPPQYDAGEAEVRHWWTPYIIPSTLLDDVEEEGPPLLFVF